MKMALKYKTIYEDDIQWLIDNKLNKVKSRPSAQPPALLVAWISPSGACCVSA